MNIAYKYRIYPNENQKILIDKTFDCVRFIYNKMLQDRKSIYEKYKDDPETLKTQKYPLPAMYKKDYPWLKEVDSLALANAQMNLQAAYRNFFNNKHFSFPKFKKKKTANNSYTTNNQKNSIRIVTDSKIRLPKLKDVKIKLHRPLLKDSIIKSATISKSITGKYFVSLLLEFENDAKISKTAKPELPAVFNVMYPPSIGRTDKKIRKIQEKIAKCMKNSENRKKWQKKLAVLFEKKANQKKDFLHKFSRQIANALKEKKQTVFIGKHNPKINLKKSDESISTLQELITYKVIEQNIA